MIYKNDENNKIDKNVKHNIIGKVSFGVICTPPFDSSSEKYY